VAVTYEIHNADVLRSVRTCEGLLTTAQENAFVEDGFVVLDEGLNANDLKALGDAADALAAAKFPGADDKTYQTEFAGRYLRDPHRQDLSFLTLPLLDYRIADTVRSLIGPRIVLRNTSVRVTRPGSGDGTVWHTDFRPHVSPAPRLGQPPVVISVLIYLDAADADTGPLYVLPRSHEDPRQPEPTDTDLPGQRVLTLRPGQIVLMNSALWHRGGSNASPDRTRRLLTLQLSSIYLQPFNFESTLPSVDYQRFVERAIRGKDEPVLELLNLGGVNPVSARY